MLFKRFADIDGIDLELATEDVDRFCDAVELLAPTFGGINLEDIKAPESFIIEERLRERCDIPVMHDDQHGTAIIAAAGLVNALRITDRSLADIRMVVNGAGAAAIATLSLLKSMGMPNENAVMCDSRGVIYRGRTEGMNQWKSIHAVETDLRTLDEAMDGFGCDEDKISETLAVCVCVCVCVCVRVCMFVLMLWYVITRARLRDEIRLWARNWRLGWTLLQPPPTPPPPPPPPHYQ